MRTKSKAKRPNAEDICQAILYFATQDNASLLDLISFGKDLEGSNGFISSGQIIYYVEENVLPNLSNEEIQELKQMGTAMRKHAEHID